ncbi:MAG: YciI family protein, partial [Streptosporangiaceae bacterium]
MTYLMLICVAEDVQLTREEEDAMGSATDSWVAEMGGRGVRREGAPLQPVREAALVRMRDGEVLISDGPFAETKEQIAGYDVIECSSLDEAIEVAARHPAATFGAIEVRPFSPDGWSRPADSHGPGDGPGYLMIHCLDATAPLSPADDCRLPGSPASQALAAWDEETSARGVQLAGGRLQLPGTARTVRVRDGQLLVSDGPFAETKEQVAGLNVLACPSLTHAVEIAAQH